MSDKDFVEMKRRAFIFHLQTGAGLSVQQHRIAIQNPHNSYESLAFNKHSICICDEFEKPTDVKEIPLPQAMQTLQEWFGVPFPGSDAPIYCQTCNTEYKLVCKVCNGIHFEFNRA